MTALIFIGALVLYPWLWRLAVVDGATFRLPDRLTLPLVAAGLIWSVATRPEALWDPVLGAVVGYAMFALVGWGFFRWRGVEGLGLGDAKLLAAGGAWTGLTTLPWIVLLAALGALAMALAKGSDRSTRIAFGPWIALAIGICWAARQALQAAGLDPAT